MMDFLLGMVPGEVSKRCYFLACGVLNYLEVGSLEGLLDTTVKKWSSGRLRTPNFETALILLFGEFVLKRLLN